MIPKYVRIAGLLLFLFGLRNQALFAQEFPRGEVVPKVVCAADSEQSYALYLPTQYTPGRQCPLLYVFDPVARGELAVNIFKAAAEEFGYILAGSNNARNGPWEPIIAAINAMSPDLDRRFSIDGKRLYATGFSGGSRVASLVGIETGGLAGVIGCGAGFPQFRSPDPTLTFDYVGLIGNQDMNYLEMQGLEKDLLQSGIRHVFISFEGGHQWPPEPAIRAAFLWLEFRAIERGLQAPDSLLLVDFLSQMKDSLQGLGELGQTYRQYLLAQQTWNFLSGVPGTEEQQAYWWGLVEELSGSAEVGKGTALRHSIAARERDLLARYMDAFQRVERSPFEGDSLMKTDSWWKREVKALNVIKEESIAEEERWLGSRMIDYLWRGAFVRWRASYQNQQFDLAEKFVRIWSIVAPTQPDCQYAWAKTKVAEGLPQKALKHLEEAVELGFNDLAYLQQDPAFDPVRDHKKYQAVIRALSEP